MRIEAKLPGAIGPEHWFVLAWARAMGEVVEALDLGAGAGPLEVLAGPAEPERWAAWADPVWHTQSWTPGDGARLWLGCSDAVPRALWAHIRGGDSSGAAAQALETFREVLNQGAAGAAAEAASRLGSAVRASAAEEASAPESGWAVELRFLIGTEECAIALAGNVALARALDAAEPEPPAPAEVPVMQPDAAPPRARPFERRSQEREADPLELIREVNLELAVSFGDTTMTLAEVLKLASGVIIELNRSVSDPVEVLVNDTVIARGDVVVVDGNYGVRVTEIVSRRDRVRSML